MPLEPRQPLSPRRPAAREPQLRVTMFPATPTARPATRPLPRGESPWPVRFAIASAALLLVGSVGWAPLGRLATHGLADYHYYAGREAARRGEQQIVVQDEWQRAAALDPGYARVRLDLARSYIDGQWLGGAIAQAEAVLAHPHTAEEGSLAYTYLGYSHYLLGNHAMGQAELELAVATDAQNGLAQSVLERLRRQGKLPEL